MSPEVAWPRPDHPADLGEPERVFRQAKTCWPPAVVRLAVALSIAAAICYVAYSIVKLGGGLEPPGSTCVVPIALGVVALAVMFLGTPALQAFDQCWSQRDDAAVICSKGVAYYHQGAWRWARWNEIVEVRTVEDKTGRELTDEVTRWGSTTDELLAAAYGMYWTILGGDVRNYAIKTKIGSEIELGGTLSGIHDLIKAIHSRASEQQQRTTNL